MGNALKVVVTSDLSVDPDLLAVNVSAKTIFGDAKYKHILRVSSHSRLLAKSRVKKSFIYPS